MLLLCIHDTSSVQERLLYGAEAGVTKTDSLDEIPVSSEGANVDYQGIRELEAMMKESSCSKSRL
jgi:hypothetical protein